MKEINVLFARLARWIGKVTAQPVTFLLAIAVVVVWAITGPIFGFSDTWQLVINTGTTIITFLMVFLIQNTQNRDTEAMHVKLDELIRSVHGANNVLMGLEDDTERDLEEVKAKYVEVAEKAKETSGKAAAIGTPEIDLSAESEKLASAAKEVAKTAEEAQTELKKNKARKAA